MSSDNFVKSGNTITIGNTQAEGNLEVKVETVRLANEHERFLGGFGHFSKLEGGDIEIQSVGFIKNICWFGENTQDVAEKNTQVDVMGDEEENPFDLGELLSIPDNENIEKEKINRQYDSHSYSPSTY